MSNDPDMIIRKYVLDNPGLTWRQIKVLLSEEQGIVVTKGDIQQVRTEIANESKEGQQGDSTSDLDFVSALRMVFETRRKLAVNGQQLGLIVQAINVLTERVGGWEQVCQLLDSIELTDNGQTRTETSNTTEEPAQPDGDGK
jgi:hypothetical protein